MMAVLPVRCAALLLILAAIPSRARASDAIDENFAVHGQFTYVEQSTSDFNAPYAGPNSLTPDRGAETVDATLILGARLWKGAEFWVSPEIDQGFGLDDTLGAAGFPSGEAYKIGKNQPYTRLTRLFIRQTVNLDDERENVDPAALQLGGTRSPNRLVITVGKISIPDIFDTNQYAHDPKNDFLNWAAIDAGTFDYAADSWGYTAGAAVEWYRLPWVVRFGIFDLSTEPNSPDLESAFHEFQYDFEVERDFKIDGRPGALRVTAYESRGRMGLLDQAVALAESTDTPVDIASVRQYRSRVGLSMSLEQQLTDELGAFARAGKAGGNVEPYEFTDIDRALSAGLSLQGAFWHRGNDTVALACMLDNISAARQRYLDAGGLGILVGDGRLPHPGPEKIVETYYSLALPAQLHLSFDYQYLANPAYNRDRGPVSVLAVRVHAQF